MHRLRLRPVSVPGLHEEIGAQRPAGYASTLLPMEGTPATGGSGIIDNTNGLEQYFLPLVMSH